MSRRIAGGTIAFVALLTFAFIGYVSARSKDPVPASLSVEVSPTPATVVVGGSIQLKAVLRDDAGREVQGHQFQWWTPDASVARVDQTGLVTGVRPGTVTVAAITEDRSESGFADITVTRATDAVEVTASPDSVLSPPPVEAREGASPTPPEADADPQIGRTPPSAPDSQRLNEPAGFRFMTARQFDDYDENGWKDRHHGRTQTIEDGAMRITFPTGFKGGSAPGQSSVRFGGGNGLGAVYLAFDYLLSSNWEGHGSGMNKMWFFNGPVGGNTIATVKAYGKSGASQFPIQVTVKQTKTAVSGKSGTNLMPNRGGPRLQRGVRHLVEIVIKMNSVPGRHDGELHVWVDGVQTHEYTPARGNGVNWWEREGRDRIGSVKWTPVWGGVGGTVSQGMYAEVSHAYVSGIE